MFAILSEVSKEGVQKYKLDANPHWEIEAGAPNDHVPAPKQTKPFCHRIIKALKTIS